MIYYFLVFVNNFLEKNSPVLDDFSKNSRLRADIRRRRIQKRRPESNVLQKPRYAASSPDASVMSVGSTLLPKTSEPSGATANART